MGIGIVMVYSASAFVASQKFDSPHFFLKRQIVRAALGLLVMTAVMHFDYKYFKKLAKPLLIISVLFLTLTIIPGIGGRSAEVTNANRWIHFFSLTFQPAELVKLALVMYLAESLVRKREHIKDFSKGFLPLLLVIGLVFFVLILQPSFGAAVLIATISFTLLFVGGVNILHMALIALGSFPVLYYLIINAEYRYERWKTFIGMNPDPLEEGYHIKQSLIALGSGKVFGLGLGQSKQKLFFLPEPHTDFIFSIIGEELGFIGAFLMLSIFLFFAWRGIIIAKNAPDRFGFYLAFGLTLTIFLSAVVNIGVATKLLPTTGLPLPFISYGGSSLLFALTSVGILLNISKHQVVETQKRYVNTRVKSTFMEKQRHART
jgi:cell division protein FtsW